MWPIKYLFLLENLNFRHESQQNCDNPDFAIQYGCPIMNKSCTVTLFIAHFILYWCNWISYTDITAQLLLIYTGCQVAFTHKLSVLAKKSKANNRRHPSRFSDLRLEHFEQECVRIPSSKSRPLRWMKHTGWIRIKWELMFQQLYKIVLYDCSDRMFHVCIYFTWILGETDHIQHSWRKAPVKNLVR